MMEGSFELTAADLETIAAAGVDVATADEWEIAEALGLGVPGRDNSDHDPDVYWSLR